MSILRILYILGTSGLGGDQRTSCTFILRSEYRWTVWENTEFVHVTSELTSPWGGQVQSGDQGLGRVQWVRALRKEEK